MAFAFVASSVKAFPEGAEAPFRNCFEQILEFNLTAANTDQKFDLAAAAALDSTNGPAILTALSRVNKLTGSLVLQSARASEGALATGNATITNYANLLSVIQVDTITCPTFAGATDRDYAIVTSELDGTTWAVYMDKTGASAAPTGALYTAVNAARKINADISGATTDAEVATIVRAAFASLTAIAASITVAASSGADISFTQLLAGEAVNPVVKNLDDTGAGSISTTETVLGREADIISVGGVDFTAQAAAVVLGDPTFRSLTDVNTTAVSLAAQINAHATTSALVTASAAATPSGVVTITAKEMGHAGNDVALAYTDGAGEVSVGATVSGANLAGGLPTAGYYLNGTSKAPVFNFPGSGDTPTALHFVLRFRLNRDETPFIYNNV